MNFLLTNAQKELLLYIQLIPEYIAKKAEFKGENLKNVVDKLVEGDSDFTPQDLEYLEDEGFIDADYNLIQKGIVFVEDFAFSEKQDILLKDRKKKATPSNGEPFIYDGTTYLPVRAVAEALGEVVDWDGNTNTVYIGTERPIATPTPTPTATNLKTGDHKSDGSGRVLVIENRNGQDILIYSNGAEYALDRDERGVVVHLQVQTNTWLWLGGCFRGLFKGA